MLYKHNRYGLIPRRNIISTHHHMVEGSILKHTFSLFFLSCILRVSFEYHKKLGFLLSKMLFFAPAAFLFLTSHLSHALPYAYVDDSAHLQDALVARDAQLLYEQNYLYPRNEDLYEHLRRGTLETYDLPRRWINGEPVPASLLRRMMPGGFPPSAPSSRNPSEESVATQGSLGTAGSQTPSAGYQTPQSHPQSPPGTGANTPVPPQLPSHELSRQGSITSTADSFHTAPLPPSRQNSGQPPPGQQGGDGPGKPYKQAAGVIGAGGPAVGAGLTQAGAPTAGAAVTGVSGAAAGGLGVAGGIKDGDHPAQIAHDNLGNAASVIGPAVGATGHGTAAAGTAGALTGTQAVGTAVQHGQGIANAPNPGQEAINRAPAMAQDGTGLLGAGVAQNSAALGGASTAAHGVGMGAGGTSAGIGGVRAGADALKGKNTDPENPPRNNNRKRDAIRRSIISRQVEDRQARLMELLARSAEKRAIADFLSRRQVLLSDEL